LISVCVGSLIAVNSAVKAASKLFCANSSLVMADVDVESLRFRQSQYKRNCVPDGPKITLSLSPSADWRMPSDS